MSEAIQIVLTFDNFLNKYAHELGEFVNHNSILDWIIF